jgi:AraC family L-rhamnose operon regulatory protein RhaS
MAISRASMKPARKGGSAVFLSPNETYHADRCEPLRKAVRRGEVRLAAFARRGYPGRSIPASALPELSTVGFWDATGPQNWGLDWHRNEGIELTYLSRGRTRFLVDEESFLLESGSLTITRPWQQHRLGNPNIGASRLCWLILDVGVRRPNQRWQWPDWLLLSARDLQRLTTLLSHNEQSVWRGNEEIGNVFEKLARLVQMPNFNACQSRLRLHINELFVVLLELLETSAVQLNPHFISVHRTVELFLQALPKHLEHPWTLPDMARQCGLGTSAFTDYCRRITNLSPMKHLARCRVEAAKEFLRTQAGLSVTDVAFKSGFESTQYFATVFRHYAGCTPREFRASANIHTAR